MPGKVAEEALKPIATWQGENCIECVAFAPYEWCNSLLAVAMQEKLQVLELKRKDSLSMERIWSWPQNGFTSCISWYPDSSLTVAPRCLKIVVCVGSKLVVHSTDCSEQTKSETLGQHKDFINSVAVEPIIGELVASTSDDHTLRIWESQTMETPTMQFLLSSPGMSVCWHKDEPKKLLVAEKGGIIRMYSVAAWQPIMSINTSKVPLLSADWCLMNSLIVTAVAAEYFYVWDISKPSQPLKVISAFSDAGRHIRMCRGNPHFLAVSSQISRQVKVYLSESGKLALVLNSSAIAGPPSWHQREMCVAVGGDKTVSLYVIPNY